MDDGVDEHGREHQDGWSAVAADWAALWAPSGEPARRVLLDATRTGPGTRLLDVGCGSGELLALAAGRGAVVAGADPAPGMVALARDRAPGADVREAGVEHLPWPDGAFDVATVVNALGFADDDVAALREVARVLVPGGRLALAGWAEGACNDLDVIERAVARAAGEEPSEDPDLRRPGGRERLLAEAGLVVEAAGLVEVPWTVPDDDALVRGVLLGEDAEGLAEVGPVVVEAAAPFRTPDGGYRLVNAYRWAVGRVPGR